MGSPYYGYSNTRPGKLDLEIQDIREEYKDRISSAKQDKTLPKRERKAIIKNLKLEKERQIMEAKKNYNKRF